MGLAVLRMPYVSQPLCLLWEPEVAHMYLTRIYRAQSPDCGLGHAGVQQAHMALRANSNQVSGHSHANQLLALKQLHLHSTPRSFTGHGAL